MPDGTQVVLRSRDGRTERATLLETDAEREVFKVAHDGGASEDIPFANLKAVFYPRESLAKSAQEAAEGSTISVEFSDGEVIRGLAHYNPERNGFFLFPLDRSKNDRIFVVNSAISSIEVEKL